MASRSDSEDDFEDDGDKVQGVRSEKEKEMMRVAESFDELSDSAMRAMESSDFSGAAKLFEQALKVDAKFEGNEISRERADLAYNLGCCFAQTRELDEARSWLRRAVMWGVRDVDPSVDEHLAPMRRLRDWTEILESFLPPSERVPAAALLRSRRQNAGRKMQALSKAMAEEEEEEDDGGSFEADDDDNARDVFDSDFDESEEEDDSDSDEEDENGNKKKKKKKKKQVQKEEVTMSSQRAAARAAREINAMEVEGNNDDDDEDDDFKDAVADAEMAEAFSRPDDTKHQVSKAAEAEKRKRKVDAAFLDINDFQDDDDDLLLAGRAKEKKLKPPEKKKIKLMEFVDEGYFRPRPTALEALSEIFGYEAAAKIIARARRARRQRKKILAAPSTTSLEAAEAALDRQTLVETRNFAGTQVEIRREIDDHKGGLPAKEQQQQTKGEQRKDKPKGGIDAVLEGLKGPKTVTAVAKSAYDWDTFKQKKGLEDSLRDASRKGYLANQDVLQRVDLRQFEQERDQRQQKRNDAQAAAEQQQQK